MSMTTRQLSIVVDIGRKLGIEYEGNDGSSVVERFIAKHIDELREYNKAHKIPRKPTGKQMKYISRIEKELDVEFTGVTFDNAWDFIADYCNEALMHKDGIY